ncbi:hypothetical protein EXS73_02970, partial [Candidatus Pacearchaeota archaeon]|nr:hypothetical protein [Candidatus Pacearchaeota archaeon]
MIKQILSLIVVLFAFSLVSANVLELVAVNQDIIDGTGAFIGPRTPLTGASVEGYLCGDATCTFSSGTFLPSTLIPGSSITIDYPTSLTSPFGYALFYTKTGYIPYEVRSTYAGTGSVTGETILSKKQSCTIPLTLTSLTNSTNVTITGTLPAPFTHTGPLPFVPPTLLSHYQTANTLTLTLANSTFTTTTTQSPLLNFSETKTFTITTNAPNATYTSTLTTTSTDSRCLASPSSTNTSTVTLGTLPTNTSTGTPSLPLVTILSPLGLTYPNNTILINLSLTNATTTTVSIPGNLSVIYTAPFTINLSNGTYTLTANASNAAGSTLASVTFTIATGTVPPTNLTNLTNLPPATVTNLRATNQTLASITWNWTNPADTDFSHVQLFLNNLFVGNTSATSYTALGLLPNTSYALTLFTVDNASIINTTGITNTTSTLSGSGSNSTNNTNSTGNSSLGIPNGVANLQALTRTNTSIVWNWTNPSANFSHVGIYLNGIFQLNTSATNFTALNLQPNTAYTLSIFTFNASGAGSGIPVTSLISTLTNIANPTNQTTTTNGGNGNTNRKRTATQNIAQPYTSDALFLNTQGDQEITLFTRK